MKILRRVTLPLLAVALALPALAGEPLQLKDYGFSIKPLTGQVADAPVQVLTMSLPASDGFAPNINVQLQPFAGKIEEYVKISKEQFGTMGLEVLRSKVEGKDDASFESKGPFQGRTIHWYARVKLAKGKAYLATATATETQWPTLAAQLMDCVDSLKLSP